MTNIDHPGSSGRSHHIALPADTRKDILRAAAVCLEASIHIETGPHKHARGQARGLKTIESSHTHGTRARRDRWLSRFEVRCKRPHD